MNYDPFARGPHPVGVCTMNMRHASLADRPAAVELWYPAQRATHLASHGYLVAAADFPGDNIADLVPRDGAEAAVANVHFPTAWL